MPISEENAERCLQLLQECRSTTNQNNPLQGEILKTFNVLTTFINNLLPSGDLKPSNNGPIVQQDGRDKEEIFVFTFQTAPKSVLEFGIQLAQAGNRGGSFTSPGALPSNLPEKRSVGNIKISVLPPNGYAYQDGKLKAGDELLEISGYLMERCSVERAR